MTEPIGPIPPIGPLGPGAIEESGAVQPVKPVPPSGGNAPIAGRESDIEGKRDFIPAHRVDLSLDPQLIRKIPRDVYLRYYVRSGIGNWVVQIIDRETQEVIREIPPGGLKEFLQELAQQKMDQS